MRPVFLDFEASSLSVDSYPIEVAWVDRAGQGESYLIRPEANWTDWSPRSQELHGISREQLSSDGVPVTRVAKRLTSAVGRADTVVYSDNPEFDQEWLRTLYIAVGLKLPFTLVDVRDAYANACDGLDAKAAADIIAAAVDAQASRSSREHRALSDAEGLWRTWRAVGDAAQRERAAG